jgi:hypothetical protein
MPLRMMSVVACLLLAMASCAPAAFAETPRSGFVHAASYTINEHGKQEGEQYSVRTWFRGNMTRTERNTRWPSVRVNVAGRGSWSAYPDAGRIESHTKEQSVLSHPEDVRRAFARTSANRHLIETTLDGRRCWKYSYHKEAQGEYCLRVPAQDFTCWVLADPDYPLVLRIDAEIWTYRVLDLKLNTPVSEDLFRKPDGLKPIEPCVVPNAPFVIEYEQENAYTRTNTSFIGNGIKVALTEQQRRVDSPAGRDWWPYRSHVLPREQHKSVFFNLQVLNWHLVKKIGQETLLGLSCDILQNTLNSESSTDTFWVTDHPAFGTICLKRIIDYGDKPTTMWVTQIGLRRPPSLQIWD